MRTPDEIKKGLECCTGSPTCSECPYYREIDCNAVEQDALAYIEQLERERDAAVEDCIVAGEDYADLYWETKRMEAAAPKWISVEERLPEEKTAVLAFGQRYVFNRKKIETWPMTHVAYTRGEEEGWFGWDSEDVISVTHWMPLPEPPKEYLDGRQT